MKIDLMSISGHKVYAPKGVGALHIRRRPRVRLLPLIDGGGQERGLRSGTLPTPLCVGLGRAAALAAAEMGEEAPRLLRLRERLYRNLVRRVPGLRLNGDPEHRLPGSLNLSFSGVTAPELIEACPSVAMSTGSACTSAAVEPSYVLRELGLPDDVANASIRLGLGRFREKLGPEGTPLRNGWVCRYDLAEACRLAVEDETIDFDVFHIVGTPEADGR